MISMKFLLCLFAFVALGKPDTPTQVPGEEAPGKVKGESQLGVELSDSSEAWSSMGEGKPAVLRNKRQISRGTKWCGRGNNAGNYWDLGEERRTDMCCRTHDHCPVSIPSFSSRYGLRNMRFYTVSGCVCDNAFRSCLYAVNTEFSRKIGRQYFNYLNPPCVVVRGQVGVYHDNRPF